MGQYLVLGTAHEDSGKGANTHRLLPPGPLLVYPAAYTMRETDQPAPSAAATTG